MGLSCRIVATLASGLCESLFRLPLGNSITSRLVDALPLCDSRATEQGRTMTPTAEYLTDLRAVGWSDRNLANELGTHRATIHRLRTGKTLDPGHDLGTAIEAFWRINRRNSHSDRGRA